MITWKRPTLSDEAVLGVDEIRDFAIDRIFDRVVVGALLCISSFFAVRSADLSKMWDHWMYGGSVFLGVVIVLLGGRRKLPLRAVDRFVSVAAIAGLAIGIVAVERPEYRDVFWEGFGLSVLIVAVAISPLLSRLIARGPVQRRTGTMLACAAIAIVAIDVPSFLRRGGFAPDVTNNNFLLSELLAPSAGRVPDGNFIPQYSTLYGWLLKPFASHVGAATLTSLAIGLMAVLSISALALAVYVAHLALGRRSPSLATLMVLPVASVTVLHGSLITAIDSSLVSTMQEFPVRLFPGFAIAALAVVELRSELRHRCRRARWAFLGAAVGLVVWNSQDFGLAMLVALTLVLAISLRPFRSHIVSWACWGAGVVVGLTIYPAVVIFSGAQLQLQDVDYFARAFGAGFGMSFIQVPGPVLLVLPVALGTAAVGMYCLNRWALGSVQPDEASYVPAVVAALIGTWSTLGFLYYLNRSYASGQLQVLLTPVAVGIAALLALRSQAGRGTGVQPGIRRASTIGLLGGVLIAAALQSPNPIKSLSWFFSPPKGYSYPTQAMKRSVADVRAMQVYAKRRGETVGFFGGGGIYVSLATGAPYLYPFDDPIDSIVNPATAKVGCQYMLSHATTWLVLGDGEADRPICNIYQPAPSSRGLPVGRVERRSGAN